jgi:hypothetical protein
VRFVSALVVALVAAGCGGAGAAHAPAHGWVAGIALTGRAICPAPTADGMLCHPTPLAHAVLIVTGPGGARRIVADASGRFRVALRPGRYSVRSGPARPVGVRVVAGRVARIHMRAPRR